MGQSAYYHFECECNRRILSYRSPTQFHRIEMYMWRPLSTALFHSVQSQLFGNLIQCVVSPIHWIRILDGSLINSEPPDH